MTKITKTGSESSNGNLEDWIEAEAASTKAPAEEEQGQVATKNIWISNQNNWHKTPHVVVAVAFVVVFFVVVVVAGISRKNRFVVWNCLDFFIYIYKQCVKVIWQHLSL